MIVNSSFCLVFQGSYLKQKKATFTQANKVNLFIAC